MRKFEVLMSEMATYLLVVEATDEDDAEKAAEEAFVQGEYCFVASTDRHVIDVQEVKSDA